VLLNEEDGSAPTDTLAYETLTFWRSGDDTCDITLPDGSLVVSARGDADGTAQAAVKADIQSRIASGSSTPVTKGHLDDLGITDAILHWAGS
tara:strand:+ start:844 stop:1119 length:276 start_codon:yes stop_codon:yes gene_type:complete